MVFRDFDDSGDFRLSKVFGMGGGVYRCFLDIKWSILSNLNILSILLKIDHFCQN